MTTTASLTHHCRKEEKIKFRHSIFHWFSIEEKKNTRNITSNTFTPHTPRSFFTSVFFILSPLLTLRWLKVKNKKSKPIINQTTPYLTTSNTCKLSRQLIRICNPIIKTEQTIDNRFSLSFFTCELSRQLIRIFNQTIKNSALS